MHHGRMTVVVSAAAFLPLNPLLAKGSILERFMLFRKILQNNRIKGSILEPFMLF
jgi:hypothetical protein